MELVLLKEMVSGSKGTVQKCQAMEIVAVEKGGKSGILIESWKRGRRCQ